MHHGVVTWYVIKWKHFPRYWPFVRGIHRSPVNSPHKGQWRGTFFFDLQLNKWLGKQSWGWWLETLSCPLWRHCNGLSRVSSITTTIRVSSNYASPVYAVATICHQVRWLRWGHPSLFHTATSLLIWYKMFCVRDISYRLMWVEFINMFSVYAQSGTHSRFNW